MLKVQVYKNKNERMRMKKLRLTITTLALISALTPASAVFATNPYNIEYEGGAELGTSNVQVAPELINGLTPIIKPDDELAVALLDNSALSLGYVNSLNQCVPRYYLRITQDGITTGNNLSITISNDTYTVTESIKNVFAENVANSIGEGEFLAVLLGSGTAQKSFSVSAGSPIFQDATCTTRVSGTKQLNANNGTKLFVEIEVKVYDKKANKIWSPDEVYYYFGDIDSAQSFKILNQDSLMSAANMYAKSVSALQPSNPEITSRNMFVANGNYIYSQPFFSIDADADIYAKVTPQTVQDGAKVVLGFARVAGSEMNYYFKPADESSKGEEDKDKNKDSTGVPNTGIGGIEADFAKIISGAALALPILAIGSTLFTKKRCGRKVKFNR